MAMSYTSLTAAKGTSGSVATWVDYTKLDVPVTVDEAQTLLYGMGLRTREMRASFNFTMPVGSARNALPAGFLEPIGRIYQPSINSWIAHKDQGYVQGCMNYTETSGALGTDPFTTTLNTANVQVFLPGHNLTQNSVFFTTGATTFNGVTIAGTYPVAAILDADNFLINIAFNLGSIVTLPTASGSGGGSAITYTADALTQGQPQVYGIWDERLYFDQAFSQLTLCKLNYYQSPPLLAANNTTNFLTNRYPHLLRTACMAAAADFMKDDVEYQKLTTRLGAMIQATNIENDMAYRGIEVEAETP